MALWGQQHFTTYPDQPQKKQLYYKIVIFAMATTTHADGAASSSFKLSTFFFFFKVGTGFGLKSTRFFGNITAHGTFPFNQTSRTIPRGGERDPGWTILCQSKTIFTNMPPEPVVSHF